MLKGVVVRIYPNEEQVEFINNQLGCCRFVYNRLVEFVHNRFAEKKESSSASEIYLEFKRIKKDNAFLNDVHSKVLGQTRINFISAYKRFFREVKLGHVHAIKKGKYKGWMTCEPKFKRKGDSDSCTFIKQAFIGIKGNRISLVKKLRDIHFKCSSRDERFLNSHQDLIRTVTIRKTCSGKYLCSIIIDDDRVPEVIETKNEIGIDLGVKDIVVTSDGDKFESPKIYVRRERRISRLSRIVNRRKSGSNRRRKARIALAKEHEKIANIRKNFLHQLSTKIVRENQVCCMEDLDVNEMMKNRNLSKRVADASMSSLQRMIEYKSKLYGRVFVKIGRFTATSKPCNVCGYYKSDLKLKTREWECPVCGTKHDRDVNAAINILKEGKKLIEIGLSSPESKARGHALCKVRSPKLQPSKAWMNREKNVN